MDRKNRPRTASPTAWSVHHNRGEILRTVISTADERLDGVLPMDLDGVSDTFRDELDLLGALSLKWHTRLPARIERELTHGPTDLDAAAVAGWRATARDLPGIRMILDHYRDHPTSVAMEEAMARSTAKEHVLLAVLAGKAPAHLGLDPDADRVGEQIEQRARAGLQPIPAPGRAAGSGGDHRAEDRPGLLHRLMAALAA